MAARIRRATVEDAAAIAAVHVAGWHESYAGIVPAAALAKRTVKARTERWRAMLTDPAGHDHGATFVACEDDGAVVGFAACGPQRTPDLAAQGFDGEFFAIYLLRAAQRRGIGHALMAALARDLAGRGLGCASLWVFEENHPAQRFYDALGGALVGRNTFSIEGTDMVEVAYGWRDLAPLLAAPKSSQR